MVKICLVFTKLMTHLDLIKCTFNNFIQKTIMQDLIFSTNTVKTDLIKVHHHIQYFRSITSSTLTYKQNVHNFNIVTLNNNILNQKSPLNPIHVFYNPGVSNPPFRGSMHLNSPLFSIKLNVQWRELYYNYKTDLLSWGPVVWPARPVDWWTLWPGTGLVS